MKFTKFLLSILLVGLSLFLFYNFYYEAEVVEPQVTTTTSSSLQWHAIQDLPNLQRTSPKKVLIDVYTDWCRWCKVMDKQTFTDPTLIAYLDAHYHLVKLNAEDKSNIQFKGQTFKYVPGGRRGYNQIAAALLNGQLSYPSFVILDENLNILDILKGYKDAKTFQKSLEKALR